MGLLIVYLVAPIIGVALLLHVQHFLAMGIAVYLGGDPITFDIPRR